MGKGKAVFQVLPDPVEILADPHDKPHTSSQPASEPAFRRDIGLCS